MSIDHHPRRRSGPGRAAGGLGVLALVGAGLAVAPAASAAPVTEFSSSFETGQALPPTSTSLDAPVNVTGTRYDPGSLMPYVTAITARGANGANEPAAAAGDGNKTTKWLDFSSTSWLRYTLSAPHAVTSYQLTSGGDAPERDPRNFTLEGSNDNGATWTAVDTRTGIAWQEGSNQNRGVTKTFEVTGAAAYSSYRLNITANQSGGIIQLAEMQLLGAEGEAPAATPMISEVGSGPVSSPTAKTGVGFSGLRSLRYSGAHVADGPARATNTLFDVDVAIEAGNELSYAIFPILDSDLEYSATYVAVDLVFTDGTRLSGTDVTDVYGYGASARAQGQSDLLMPNQWNSVRVDLSAFAGKTVDTVALSYDNPDGRASTAFSGWLDDVTIEPITIIDDSDGLVSYVDTRRGTHSSTGYSRGNNIPATGWPNGFNFFVPMTNGSSTGTIYEWHKQNSAQNLPELEAITISHQPSPWMGDRNQLAVLPAAGTNPTSTLNDRELPFRHENETARPDLYQVEFENGITTAVTPTDHGGVYRFTFTGNTGSVLVDKVSGDSKLTLGADGSLTGWVDGGSGWPGRSRMFVSGQFDATPTNAGPTTVGNRNDSARFAAFSTATDKTVELRLATSFISQDQAHHNFDLEVEGLSFEDAQDAATQAWNERLGVLEVEGATQEQLVTSYSNLYRLNLYPNSQFENTGTAQDPVYRYASPVSPKQGDASDTQTNAPVKDGKIYVNNGFWDTYRTAWPMYATLYPELAEELVDGFTQHYRDGGWIARWSSPGYADLMTGTSSDVAFADAYLAGALGTNLGIESVLDTYDAALKNATVLPATNAVGRKGLETSIFQGWTQEGTHESASWGLEGYINDFGIAQMAGALAQDPRTPAERVPALQEEATYFEARSKNYVTMFNPEANTFTARNLDGTFAAGADFDKLAWGGAFTEASAWTFGFHVPFDVDGLAALYGGRADLVDVLDEFMSTPEIARSGIHEAFEARDVRRGLLGISNQVAHHIPYIYAAAGEPHKTQELVRDITQRLFAGSDIGQGYLGDEDNGELSAWYLFSALGFYPLQVGSGDFTIGSPLFDGATLHLPGGDLVISAEGAAAGKKYVAGVTFDGTPLEDVVLDGDLLRGGGELVFTMSDTPTAWGEKDQDEALAVPEILVDATKPGFGTLAAADGTAVGALVDDNARTAVTFAEPEAVLTWTSTSGPVVVDHYTLTDGAAGHPSDWVLEGSLDGQTWVEVDAREGEEFPWNTQTRPFAGTAPGAYTQYRLTVSSATGPLVLSEIELFATAEQAEELAVTGRDDLRVDPGVELTSSLATVVGPSQDATDYAVSVDFRDGTGTHGATLVENGLGGWSVTAPHSFERTGVYEVLVTATLDGASATATTLVTVTRDTSLVGSFNNVCLGDLGATAGSCDGQGYTYDRAKLASTGYVQGETIAVGDTGLSFDLAEIPAGAPDNVTNEGQTISLQLGEGATRISFVGSANEGDKDLVGLLTYSDGSTQDVPIQLGDWVGASTSPKFGNVVVGQSNGRLAGISNEGTVKLTSVFATAPFTLAIDEAGAAKEVVSLTMPTSTGELRSGRVHLMAVADDGERGALAPLTVTALPAPRIEATEAFELALAEVTGGTGDVSATVTWGDGSELADAVVTDGVVTAGHTYAEPGTYTVTVTADDGVVSASATLEIRVEAWTEPIEFTDVPEGTMFRDEILWLADRGVTQGWVQEDGTRRFEPVQPVNRDAMAAFLYRLAGSPEFTAPEISPFTDVATSNQFYKEITWLHEQRISTGWDNGDGTARFEPLSTINRDAMAAFLFRYAEVEGYTAPETSAFADVPTSNQFYTEISWLAENGIATGWSGEGNDGTDIFRPLHSVNRDAMAAFMYRLEQLP